MPQPNDLSRSLVALDHNSTMIAVVELSQSSCLMANGDFAAVFLAFCEIRRKIVSVVSAAG